MDGTWVHNKDLHQLFGAWGVPQKGRGRKRPHDEVSRDLLAKVVEETRRLKRMQDFSESSSADAPAVYAFSYAGFWAAAQQDHRFQTIRLRLELPYRYRS